MLSCMKPTSYSLSFQPLAIAILNSNLRRSGSLISLCSLSFSVKMIVRRKMERLLQLSCGCFSHLSKSEPKTVMHNGREDVYDVVVAESNVSPDHLVFLVNGLRGSSADWKYAAEQFVKYYPNRVIIHCSECNSANLTYDGVDQMGRRFSEEVLLVVSRMPQVRKISFVSHSLGGLVARYAIARLYEHPAKNIPPHTSMESSSQEDPTIAIEFPHQSYGAKIAGLEPMNFITFATPHLGSRWHKQLPFLCGLSFLERGASQTAHLIVGRSGKHLFLTDNDDGKPPLLVQMVNDCDDLKFISALRAFHRRVAYSNASYDYLVGWRTSSIRRQHELPMSNQLVADPKYEHIVHAKQDIGQSSNVSSPVNIASERADLEEEMISGLNQVTWERVDVSFHKSRQRLIAHNTIQVKKYWLNSDGADVIRHLLDNFLI